MSCNRNAETQKSATFDSLCRIYEDIVQQLIELSMKEKRITERIKKELPRFYEQTYAHLVSADPDFRYKFIKSLADKETKNTWQCESMRSYYANEFSKPSSK